MFYSTHGSTESLADSADSYFGSPPSATGFPSERSGVGAHEGPFQDELQTTSFKKRAFQFSRSPLVDLKEKKTGCDRYGFIIPDSSAPMSASTALQRIQKMDSEVPIIRNEEERKLQLDGYLFKKGISIDSLVKSRDFKIFVRHGIPAEYRPKFWWQLSGAEEIFEDGYYQNILKMYEGKTSLATQQIELVCLIFRSPRFLLFSFLDSRPCFKIGRESNTSVEYQFLPF